MSTCGFVYCYQNKGNLAYLRQKAMSSEEKKTTAGVQVLLFSNQPKDEFKRAVWETILQDYVKDVCRGSILRSYLQKSLAGASWLLVLVGDEIGIVPKPASKGVVPGSLVPLDTQNEFVRLHDVEQKHAQQGKKPKKFDWRDILEKAGQLKNDMTFKDAMTRMAKWTFGFVVLKASPTNDEWDIDLICTAAGIKDRGSLGERLMQEVFQLAEDVDVHQIRLHAVTNVVSYYRKFGFRFGDDCAPELPQMTRAYDHLRAELKNTIFKSELEAQMDDRIKAFFSTVRDADLCYDAQGVRPKDLGKCMSFGVVMSKCFRKQDVKDEKRYQLGRI